MPNFKIGDAIRIKNNEKPEYDGQTGTIFRIRHVCRGSGPISYPDHTLPPYRKVLVYDIRMDDGKTCLALEEKEIEPYSPETQN